MAEGAKYHSTDRSKESTSSGSKAGLPKDTTAFSQWNKGIQDRFIQTVTTPPLIDEEEETEDQPTLQKHQKNQRIKQKALKEYLEKQKFDKENNFDQYLIEGFGNSFDPYINMTSTGRKPTNRSKLNIPKNWSKYFRLDNDFINRG